MRNLALSEKYAVVATLALLLLVLLDNAAVMLAVSLVGLLAGGVVAGRGEMRRVAIVATVGFAITLGFAVYTLLS